MLLNPELTALQESGGYVFDEIVIGSRTAIVVFPDGRRNIMPYGLHDIAHKHPWRNFGDDLDQLSRLTGEDAIGIATALYERVHDAVPDVRFTVDAFMKSPDRPVRFKAMVGRITIRGGFPLDMAGVAVEADRMIAGYAAAQKAIAAEVSSWKATTIDAYYVRVAAGLTGLDADAFFESIRRDPAGVECVVGDKDEVVASMRTQEIALPGGLTVRTHGNTITVTVKTKGYTLDACRLILKDAPQPPETILSAIRGQPLDVLVRIPGFDGSDLPIERIKVDPAGKKLQMIVHFAPRPLRLDDARALYEILQARAQDMPEGYSSADPTT